MFELNYLGAIIIFALATLFTPGPNNIMLASSGANFGLKKSIPHILGVSQGFPLMCLFVCLGLGQVFLEYPLIKQIMQWVTVGILIYIAFRMVTTTQISKSKKTNKPFSFLTIVAFQWVNPKAWMMAIGASSAFIKQDINALYQALIVSIIFSIIGSCSSFSWTLFGYSIRNFLEVGNRLSYYNIIMAILLLSTIYFIF